MSYSSRSSAGDDRVGMNSQDRASHGSGSSVLVWLAIWISWPRWFSLLGGCSTTRTDRDNPHEFHTVGFEERDADLAYEDENHWLRYGMHPLSLLLLHGRYRYVYATQGDGSTLYDVEQKRSAEGPKSLHLMNTCRTSLELFFTLFTLWFMMGNVWLFDSRFRSFQRAPKLHVLCIFLLCWSVPLVSTPLAHNMNMGSDKRVALDNQISSLPIPKYKENKDVDGESVSRNKDQECCICLCKYKDKEEVRQLPRSHMFHQKCVDQWLRIMSCCPLCKKELEIF